MHARRAILGPTDVQAARVQLDLRPLEIAELGGPQTVPIADQDHGGVAMTVPAPFRAAAIKRSISVSVRYSRVRLPRPPRTGEKTMVGVMPLIARFSTISLP